MGQPIQGRLSRSWQDGASLIAGGLANPRVCAGIFLATVVLIIMARLQVAGTQAFWYDELFTVHMSLLRTPTAIWNALATGADANPPLYYWLNGQLSRLGIAQHLSFRLLSVAGFTMAVAGVYASVNRRNGSEWALTAALMLALSQLTDYAVEARPYALVVGLASIAAAFWQRIDDRWYYTPLLAAALGLSVSSHYLAIAVTGCFGAAELSHVVIQRRIRWRAWLAIAASTGPMLITLPLLLHFRQTFGTHFWSKPSFASLGQSYSLLSGLSARWAEVFLVLAGFLTGNAIFGRLAASSDVETTGSLDGSELTLIVSLLLLPLTLVLMTAAQGGGYTPRYSWPMILGFVAIAVAMARAVARDVRPTWLLCALLLILVRRDMPLATGLSQASDIARPGDVVSRVEDLERAVRRDPSLDDLPIVVEQGLLYLPAAYYADRQSTARLHYLADPELSARLIGRDTNDRNLRALSLAMPGLLQIEEPLAFFAEHQRFLILSGEGWVLDYLIEQGWRPQLLSKLMSGHLYLVERP